MKLTKIFVIFLALILFASPKLIAHAGEMDILVNKLVEKNILTPYEAQILLAEAKEDAAKDLAKGEAVTAPDWTQNVKIKGDVRFRTQIDWGKGLNPAHERIRNRVRARLGVEGKVNDQITAGMLAATGTTDPRSTNQTLENNFEMEDLRLDAYYIDWTPKIPAEIGRADVWLGKFNNPFVTSELLWDTDILPAGVAAQYESKTFTTDYLPPTTLFGNFGFLWLDEISTSQRDPLMYVIQGGTRMDVIQDWDATTEMAIGYYDLAHVENNPGFSRIGAATTNTYWTGTTRYRTDFNLVDLILNYDSKAFFDFKLGHGLYTDFIWNTDSAASEDFAWMIGAYLGDKKPKDPGQWKLYGEYRYLETDSVPDFLPDSDFYGFTSAGVPGGGGTNGEGCVIGAQYAIWKNTLLGVEWYYCVPVSISSTSMARYDEPYQLLQLDIAVKF
ncbi:conserved hypothetical protein, secreted [Candidatus Omnitrophus magneticus]|uniref:Porin n=1 Tax=Candidatus Omnitrophus magneticus TaxID=1609969 RepID=A0A0F0CQM6_9BACT|nr:conserved hypothetical protein, secreted [Candidatus Omnitrophus magneticus]